MSSGSDSSRKRRSPRLNKAVEVRVAGRGESGEVIVESTETVDISKHGACVSTRSRFPIGSPIALRRPGAKPMRARVVSVKAGKDEGVMNLGVEFVGEEGNWDLEFPQEWNDYYHREPESSLSAEERRKLLQADDALEAVLKKAESLRFQAERMLAEYAAQVDGARRQNTSALASQVEEFRAWKSILSGETSAQVESAKESIASELVRSRAAIKADALTVAKRVKDLTAQCEAGLKGSEELYQQVRVSEAQKNVQQVARISSQLEAQRKTMASLEQQSSDWRKQTAVNMEALQREIQSVMQKASGEVQASSAGAIKDFRQKLPGLGKELEKYFTTFLAEQKIAATGWLEQAGKNIRAGTLALDKEHRASLEESSKQSLETFAKQLAERLEEFRKAGEVLAAPLDARAVRMRTALEELDQATNQTLANARQELSVAVEKAGQELRAMVAAKPAQIAEAEAAARQRLEQTADSLLSTTHEAARRVDQSSLDLQTLGASLRQQAVADRQELDKQFAGLLAMYDNRKQALDRLVQTVDSGRASLRDGLELLKVNAEEQQARLGRFTLDQEANLKSHTAEMEQRLAASLTAMEAELRERAAATLQTSHQDFSERAAKTSGELRQRFTESVEQNMQQAAARIPGMLQELDSCLAQHAKTLAADHAEHQQTMAQVRADFEQAGRATLEQLHEQRNQSDEALRQSLAAALAAVDDRQATVQAASAALLTSIEENRAGAVRQHGDHEKQIQRWRQNLETEFATMQSRLEEKRLTLEGFYSFAEQTKASWVKNLGVIDRRIEDARTTITAMEKQMAVAMEKHGQVLAGQLETRLRQSLETAQHELNAVAEASESVFHARLTDFSKQALKGSERQVEQGINSAALALDRTMQKERREHERQVGDIGKRFEETLREQLDGFREAMAQASAETREQMQQIGRTMLDQVKDARDNLARELPGKLSEAEEMFRRNLERIQERTVAAAAEELRARATQWKSRTAMEHQLEAVREDGD